jgi:hypothetical protein
MSDPVSHLRRAALVDENLDEARHRAGLGMGKGTGVSVGMDVDAQLAALGQVPADVSKLVTRLLGERRLTLDEVDTTLAGLTDGRSLPEPSRPQRDRPPLGFASAGSATTAPSSHPPSVPSSAESPAGTSAAPVVDSQPPPPSVAPPVIETRNASPDERPDAETTAQAIVAAFDQPESAAALAAAADPLESLAGVVRDLAKAASREAESGRSGRRGELRGSRRPDLDELLDQPLDALDFERTEPVAGEEESVAEARSEAPTGAPPPAASGDDFEILVDDEILEIAEDDVEMVDDESSS